MNPLAIIFLIVVLILLIVFVYWAFNKEKKLSGHRDAAYQKTVNSGSFTAGTNTSFAFSIWMFIGDWSINSGSIKEVFTVGNGELKVYLDETSPTLHIETMINNQPVFDKLSITDIPLQSWVCVAVSINGASMDVYLNGKLVQTAISNEGQPPMSFSSGTIVLSANAENIDGKPGVGFGGYTNNFKYYKEAITPQESYNIYKKGPGGTVLGNIIGNKGLQLNIMDGNQVSTSYNIA